MGPILNPHEFDKFILIIKLFIFKMGSLEMFSSSNKKEKIVQSTPSFPITKIQDNRNKTNSNEKFLELRLTIIIKDIPTINEKYLNLLILDDKRLLVGYTLYLILFSKKILKQEVLIDLRDIMTEYNNSTSIIYLAQLNNGNIAVVLNNLKVYFIKLSQNSYELTGKLDSNNPKKIIEKNENIYILEAQQISVWHSKFNIFPYSKVEVIPLNEIFIGAINFIFINDQEIAISHFRGITFYNLESKNKFQIRCQEHSISPSFCPKDMILLNNKILLMSSIDYKWGYGTIYIIDTIKKEIICQTGLQLYSIIKLNNGELLCGVMEQGQGFCHHKIMRLKILDEKLIIDNSQICHDKQINDIIELDNGIILSGSREGCIKVWKTI